MTAAADEPSRARELHALSGVVPMGIFVIVHVLIQSRALAGQEAIARVARWGLSISFISLLEIVLVYVPLTFHALYGVVLLVRPGRPPADSPYAANWRLLVRGSAWAALVFIAYHAYVMDLSQHAQGIDAVSKHTFLASYLSSGTSSAAGVLIPWNALFYLVGLAATTIHFAAGTWGYLVRTKRAATVEGKRRLAFGLGLAGTALFTLSSATVVALATGSPLFVSSPESPVCPAPPLPVEEPAAAAPTPSAPPAPSAAPAPSASH